jgi:hypothetical protein
MTAFDKSKSPDPSSPAAAEVYNAGTVLNSNEIYNIGWVQVNTKGFNCGFGDTVISIIPFSICGGNYISVSGGSGM